jgi:hypothetical protein
MKLEAVDTIALALDLAANPSITYGVPEHNSGQMSDASAVPADSAWGDTRALVAGADSINLAALLRGALANLDLTGKRLRAIKVVADADNADAIAFAPGAANGFVGFPEFILGPGEGAMFVFASDERAAVGAANRTVDVTGVGTDAYSIVIVAGPNLPA